MIFNSFQYMFFMVVVLVLYHSFAHRWRNLVLLLANFYFIMSWESIFGFIIVYIVILCWFYARFLSSSGNRFTLSAILVFLFLPLFTFKYLHFFADQISFLVEAFIPFQPMSFSWGKWLLPVGISFYSFMAAGYVIDVYRKDTPSLGLFKTFLFITFFAHISAGPIARANRLVPQFDQEKTLDYDRFVTGIQLILVGLFKKAVVADRLALYVNNVMNNSQDFSGASIAVATLFFAIQLYCDFSGYSDMARGSAYLLGFRLNENFHRPFLATSIRFFWSRWHISLTSWFRDYLFIPIYGVFKKGKKKLSSLLTGLITIFVFLVSGLWHGAGWNFIVWGGLNGLLLVLEPPLIRMLYPVEKRLSRTTGAKSFIAGIKLVTTTLVMSFAFLFFRADSIGHACNMIKTIASSFASSLYIGDAATFLYCLMGIFLLFTHDWLEEKGVCIWGQTVLSTSFRFALAITWIALMGVFDQSQFIYFKF